MIATAPVTACPTCGGEPDHEPRWADETYGDVPVKVHHPGPLYRPPLTIYVRLTVPAPDDYTAADLAAAAVAALHEVHPLDGGMPVVPVVATNTDSGAAIGMGQWSDEPPRKPSLYCGCGEQSEHDEGVAMQADMRKRYRIHRDACVGCVLGDDGPTMHSCAIHPV